jgi:hypothetical protein
MGGIASNGQAAIALAFGVVDAHGARQRNAVLCPATGHSELANAEDANPFRAAIHLLAQCVRELGPLRGAHIDAALLGDLLPVDRDYLLIQLTRLTFGDVRYQPVLCPRCGHRLDVRFALSGAELPAVGADGGSVVVGDGRVVAFRLPRAADQAELFGVAPADLEAAFLRRCVRDERAVADVLALPAQLRADLVKRIVAASPEMDLAVPLTCVACRQPFRFVLDPVRSLLAELRASRAELIQQVHRLALSYHWSHSEILGLPRTLRHEYLELVQAEAR